MTGVQTCALPILTAQAQWVLGSISRDHNHVGDVVDGHRGVAAGGVQHPLGLGGYLDIGILDTMKDLFVNFIGAVVFSFIGYFYVKNRGKGWFAKRFIPKVLPESGAKK